MAKRQLRSSAEVFSDARRNFEQDGIRKMMSMEIPSKKSKLKCRNRKKNFESKYFDGSHYALLVCSI